MRFYKALGAVFLVPLCGAALSFYISSQSGLNLATLVQRTLGCAQSLPSTQLCQVAHLTPGLALASTAAAAFGLGILAVYWLCARIIGSNRTLLSLIFPSLTFLALLAIAVLTVIHAAVVTIALFSAEDYWLGEVHDWVLIIAAGAGLLAAIGVATAALRSYGAARISVIGHPINPLDQPRLMLLVRNVARKLNTRPPDNVIVGMDANFFVTHAHVGMLGLNGEMRGRSLFLSVPLMRGLSVGELTAVIAHEMAHFANRDAQYSQHFAPIYARLHDAANQSSARTRSRNPFVVPVRAMTDFLVDAFHSNVARVSQKRELAADAAAAAATSPTDLANALLKVSIMSHVWHREIAALHERTHQGRFSRNISRNFADHVRLDLDKNRISDAVASIMAWQIPHPTDSHPATEDRIIAMGLTPTTLLDTETLQQRFFGQASAAEELDDLTNVEERLSFVYQKFLEHIGVARARGELDAEQTLHYVLTDFLAHMITADGEVDDREIVVAEQEARHLIPGFDGHDLRERCRHPDELLDLDKLTDLALTLLNPRGFQKLAQMLEKIALADGMQHRTEAAMLQRIRAASELALD